MDLACRIVPCPAPRFRPFPAGRPGRALAPAFLALLLPLAACSGSEGEDLLASSCVEKYFPRDHTIPLGGECSMHGVSYGCDTCAWTSSCLDGLVCAFGTCQAGGCTSDSDCADLLGGGYACKEMATQNGSKTCNYGKWCQKNETNSGCKPDTFCYGGYCCQYICVNGQLKQGKCY